MSTDIAEIVQPQRCGVCRQILLQEFAKPFSLDGKMIIRYDQATGRLSETCINGKKLYDRSGTEELIRGAADGCDMCRLFLQSLVY